ncbi:hypothetical protein CK203_017464 [Vitis vinifera]|uniref:Secreted protein n=1 Tax=Vitis vinifera TaxID=29760 RepID=A0A438IY41_VITVI|nr:hypothetical protein CK203_017464 [Vitis vinifera]
MNTQYLKSVSILQVFLLGCSSHPLLWTLCTDHESKNFNFFEILPPRVHQGSLVPGLSQCPSFSIREPRGGSSQQFLNLFVGAHTASLSWRFGAVFTFPCLLGFHSL